MMNEERKRMNAFGGRGMWFSGRFLACAARRAPPCWAPSGLLLSGKRRGESAAAKESAGLGGSLKVPGVTVGANAKPCAAGPSETGLTSIW